MDFPGREFVSVAITTRVAFPFLKETLKIEENWRAETHELQTIIRSLKDENAQLKDLIELTKSAKQYQSTSTTKGEFKI